MERGQSSDAAHALPSIELSTPSGPRPLGPGHPTFIVAELSGNHRGELGRALELVDAACDAGADAIKLQTYTADTMTIDCSAESFQVRVNDAWKGQTLYSLYEGAATPWEWYPELRDRAERRGVMLFSAPFDGSAVQFLEDQGCDLYKVASFEIGDLELLREIGRRRKPVIVSRGLASLDEIREALDTLRAAGASSVALLHCVSAYPARPEQMRLQTIPDLASRFGTVVGLSDHTLGTTVSIAAVALGARIVEKHFTLRRSDGGPDAAFSLEPGELRELVRAIRITEAALGEASYTPGERESENRVFKRSIFAVRDIAPGRRLTREDVRVIRPGYGLAPRHYPAVIGRTARVAIARGTPLHWDLLEDEGA